ncbi:MAG TPA: phospholipase D family protein [Chthoniobacteraceae bacterium]|nr:phospholipase D family protein [Chthoniobacteraceae bacterium]
MHPIHPRSIPLFGAILAILLFVGCTGLPTGGDRTPTTAVKASRGTLASVVQPRLVAHPGQSGLHPLADARDALAARLVLADEAEGSLDVQYFIWSKDIVGKVLVERLFRAADRGVRVRLLLDDLGTMPSDSILLAIDSHPNIEVRMFNPVAMRSLRVLGMVADFARINRRMHNKSFTADGQVAIVGGRNIGDEYYGASTGPNYADLDVAVIGPVVKEVSNDFDLYWNHPAAVPISALSRQNSTPERLAAKRAELREHHKRAEHSEYADTVRVSDFARQVRNRNVAFSWGRASIMSDHPDKVLSSSSETETHLAPKLREVVDATKGELFLVSPYFVPGKEGVELLAKVRQRGARVVVVTNSLASTDGIAVHSGYKRYRKPLLKAGIELYEIKPTASTRRGRNRGGGFFGSGGASGSSGASLHAKTFSFDRRIGFIGSYNLDPRSSRLNTEMGVLFDCPTLVKQLPETTERDLDRNAYRLKLDGNRLVWITQEGGKEVRLESEPGASAWKRAKVQVLSWLPIEGLL